MCTSALPQDLLCKRLCLGSPGSSPAPEATLERGVPRRMHKHFCGDALGQVLAQIGEHAETRKLLELAVTVGKAAGFPDVSAVEDTLRRLPTEAQ
jgi:hypothetical protein